MNLKDIMSRNVQVIAPDANLVEAAQCMKDLDVGGLPVCSDDRIQGFVTDRDIVVRAIADGKNPSECKVSDVMSTDVFWCYEDDSVEDAGRKMEENQIRRLLVLDSNKKLCGIVSLGDIARAQHGGAFTGEVLERVSEPAEPAQPTI